MHDLKWLAIVASIVVGCATHDYELTLVPNYDRLIGMRFSSTFSAQARLEFKKISENAGIEEFANRRPDGCVTTFGVRAVDDVIVSWRVAPSPEQCKVSRKSLNV